MIAVHHRPPRLRQTLPPTGLRALTPRERQILSLYPEEPEAMVAAHRLGISYQTFKNHVTSILHKLGVARLGLAAILYDRSLRGVSTWPDRRETERRQADRRLQR